MARTFKVSDRFTGCKRVIDNADGGATVQTPYGMVTISGDGRVNRMECWQLVADAAATFGWRRSFGGPTTYGDTQYFWERDVPSWTIEAPYVVT